jgi:hypothetical protein
MKPYSSRSTSSQRRKKHTKKVHVGFRIYDEDAEIAEEMEDWAPLHDWFTKLLRLARKPTRDYMQALREALEIPLPDPESEVATIVMDRSLYERFARVSKSLFSEHKFEPGPDQLMHIVLRRLTEDEIRQAAVDHLAKARAEKAQRAKEAPKKGKGSQSGSPV